MANKFTLAALLLFSFFLSFGVFDPVFGIRPTIGLIEIFSFLLISSSLLFNFKGLTKNLGCNNLYLLLLVFSLFLSSVLYGHSENNKSAFNFKLLVMVLIYIALSLQFKRNPKYIQYSLFAFSAGVITFIALLNIIYPLEMLSKNGRLWVFGENPNSTSARFALAAIYFVYVFVYNPFNRPVFRHISLLLSLPIIFIVLQSGSRGSVFSLALSLAMLLYFSHLKTKYKIGLSFLLASLSPYFVNLFLNTGSIAERFSNTISTGSLAGRQEIWLFALDIISKNPIFGVGEPGYLQEIKNLYGSAVDTHNLFLYILAAGGIISFTLFLLFFKNLILRSWYFLKLRDVLPFILLLNITAIASKTGGVITYSIMWFVFAIVSTYSFKNSLDP